MGKPVGSHIPTFGTEYIGDEKQTQGSETSQYLKEKKATAIPKVVASEMGRV